jgi:hypothetical protein
MNLYDFSMAKTFDRKNVENYQAQKWNKSYGKGLYFSALQDLGYELNIQIGIDLGEGLSWYQVPHALHDGLSAYKKLFKELSINEIPQHFKLSGKRLSLASIKSAVKLLKNQDHFYHGQDSSCKGQGFQYKVIRIDSKNLNTAEHLWKLNQYLSLYHLKGQKKWMIPVRTDNQEGLQASYIGVNLGDEDTNKNVQQKIKEKLILGEYKGLDVLGNLGLICGKKTILKQTKAMLMADCPNWAGSISNLKNIGSAPEVKELVLLAPVRWHRPIGLGLYVFNGISYITLCVHESLKQFDLDHFEQWAYAK